MSFRRPQQWRSRTYVPLFLPQPPLLRFKPLLSKVVTSFIEVKAETWGPKWNYSMLAGRSINNHAWDMMSLKLSYKLVVWMIGIFNFDVPPASLWIEPATKLMRSYGGGRRGQEMIDICLFLMILLRNGIGWSSQSTTTVNFCYFSKHSTQKLSSFLVVEYWTDFMTSFIGRIGFPTQFFLDCKFIWGLRFGEPYIKLGINYILPLSVHELDFTVTVGWYSVNTEHQRHVTFKRYPCFLLLSMKNCNWILYFRIGNLQGFKCSLFLSLNIARLVSHDQAKGW